MAIMRNGAQDEASEIKFNASTLPEIITATDVQSGLEKLYALIQTKKDDDAISWRTQYSLIGSIGGGGVAEPLWADVGNGLYAFHFAESKTQEAFTFIQIPSDYKANTLTYPSIHWSPDTTSTGTVQWAIEYTVTKGFSQGETFSQTSTTILMPQAGGGIAHQHQTVECNPSDAFIVPEPGAIVSIKLIRNGRSAADTFIGDAAGFTISLSYESDIEGTLNKAPNFYV